VQGKREGSGLENLEEAEGGKKSPLRLRMTINRKGISTVEAREANDKGNGHRTPT